MSKNEDDREPVIERVESEIEDSETAPATYDIVTYPADFTLEGLVKKYRAGDIIIPGFQRKFVWNIKQASRLIESFLLGLPVPAIFLYVEPNTNKHLVIDGQQRLLSIYYFMEGYFGEPSKDRRVVFMLAGLNEKSPYFQKTYETFRDTDASAFRKLNDAVLRAFIVQQLQPKGRGSIYHIFERLNTGGTQLVGQEIRNCVYHGPFNDLLGKLNKDASWRKVFGKPRPDKRQRDIELILRFLALYYEQHKYSKPMNRFLSEFMASNQKGQVYPLAKCETLFRKTVETVHGRFGDKPFHIKAGLNAAMFDAVFVALARHLNEIPKDVKQRYESLKKDPDMNALVSSATTDEDALRKRHKKAQQIFFK